MSRLDADVTYYQRLLARQDEATHLVLAQASRVPGTALYDGLLVPALNYLKRDREQEDLMRPTSSTCRATRK